MRLKQFLASFALSLVMFSQAHPQAPDPKDSTGKEQQQKAKEEREKKALVLLEETIKEAQALKLPENRLRIQVGIADLLWSRDEKRARALFKEAMAGFDEIARKVDSNPPRPDAISISSGMGRYQAMANPYSLRFVAAQLRQEITQALIPHDAKWARDFLRASRQSVSSTEESRPYTAYIDLSMDLQLASQIAGSDPKEAAEIMQDNLDRDFPAGVESVIGVMQQIQEKDHEAASKLASSILNKLRLSSQPGMVGYALNLLMAVTRSDKKPSTGKQSASKSDALLLDEQSMKNLVTMVAEAALKNANSSDDEDEDSYDSGSLMMIQSIMPQVEKYAPSLAPALRAKIAEFNKSLNPQARAWAEFASKGTEPTAEDIMNIAAKASADNREGLYEQAVQMALAKGDLDLARQITNDNLKNEGARKNLLAEIDRRALTGATTQGKLDEARQMLARVESGEDRAMFLAQLASAMAAKGDKKNALQLVNEARGLASYPPESATQFTTYIELARAAAAIDTAQSFEILESMIEQLNLLAGASAALDAFESRQQFREGEMVLKGPGSICNMLQYWSNNLQQLAREDLDRAKLACDRFQRTEVRLMIRLSIARGVLSNSVETTAPPGREIYRPFLNR